MLLILQEAFNFCGSGYKTIVAFKMPQTGKSGNYIRTSFKMSPCQIGHLINPEGSTQSEALLIPSWRTCPPKII